MASISGFAMTDHQRTARWLLLTAALVLALAGAGLMAFPYLLPPDARLHPVGGVTVILHTGGRLDVWLGIDQAVRWIGFSQASMAIAFVAVLAAALLRQAALGIGRPPPGPKPPK